MLKSCYEYALVIASIYLGWVETATTRGRHNDYPQKTSKGQFIPRFGIPLSGNNSWIHFAGEIVKEFCFKALHVYSNAFIDFSILN